MFDWHTVTVSEFETARLHSKPKMTQQSQPPTGPHLLTGAENKRLYVSCGLRDI